MSSTSALLGSSLSDRRKLPFGGSRKGLATGSANRRRGKHHGIVLGRKKEVMERKYGVCYLLLQKKGCKMIKINDHHRRLTPCVFSCKDISVAGFLRRSKISRKKKKTMTSFSVLRVTARRRRKSRIGGED
jgi:hypothetical protein